MYTTDHSKSEQEFLPNINPYEKIHSTPEDTFGPQEYVVERIIRHVGPKSNFHYDVRWYGYSWREDIVWPLKHKNTHFLDIYSAQKQKGLQYMISD